MGAYNDLKKRISGKVFVNTHEWKNAYSGMRKIKPKYVVTPGQLDDLYICYEIAEKYNFQISYRGAGHAFNGQALSTGIVIYTPKKSPCIKKITENEYRINAGAYWFDTELMLNKQKKMVPVLTDYLDLSVAGTASVGGYGIRSILYGRQIEYIKAIRLTTPNGMTQWCSISENTDLYRYTLCGLGMVGYIDEAIIQTKEYQSSTRILTFKHKNFSNLYDTLLLFKLDDQQEILQFDATYFKSKNSITSRYGFNLIVEDNMIKKNTPSKSILIEEKIYIDYHMYNHSHVKAWSISMKNKIRLWHDYVVGFSGLKKLLMLIEGFIDHDPNGKYLECLYIVAIKKNKMNMEIPFLAVSNETDDVEFLLGIYLFIPKNNEAIYELISNFMLMCLEICVQEKGMPYLQGSHILPNEILKNIYGNSLEKLNNVRCHYDPMSIIKTYDQFKKYYID